MFSKLDNEEKIKQISKDWNTPRMIDYISKHYDYYTTKDNIVIEIEKANSLNLINELWYDDEYEAPEINFDNFLAENNQPFKRLEYLIERADGVNIHWYFTRQLNSLSNVNIFTDWELQDNKCGYDFIRELTEHEKKQYLDILSERNNQYLERLKKYYKRYSNKITTHGYWANR